MTSVTNSPSSTDTASFGSLPVGRSIAHALQAMGYITPTPIQEQAIPPLREGRDVLGQAQTGTGKTAGFGIPLIERIDPQIRGVQAIVLVPTRELCIQVSDELSRLGKPSQVRVLSVYGGVGFAKQLDGLAHGAQVVVGTPGRVEDLLQRGKLRLDRVHFSVLDEADRMLDVGFLPAIDRILRQTPASRQTSLFSATIAEEIRGLAQRHMRDPVTIAVSPERATVDEIEQRFQRVADGDKLSALRAHLDDPACFLALVFRRTTYKADRLAKDLARGGYKTGTLHGRRSQPQRERVLADLKSAKLQVLVATDIAARGLDIAGLTHVFNFDLPDTAETYVHRIGRTGRAGEAGIAITLVGPEDEAGVRGIERYLSGQRHGGSASLQAGSGSRKPGQNRNRGQQGSSSFPGSDRRGNGRGVPRSRGRSTSPRPPAPDTSRSERDRRPGERVA